MVKASSQIEKELGLLQQRTEDMAQVLEPLYQGYLKALSEASKQQLMAAAYHLCTQAYPDKFLTLSWQQRNQLQKSLQKLAVQIHVQLVEQQAAAKKNSRKPQRNDGLAFLQRLLEARSSATVISTKETSSDDLLDKLSEIAQFDDGSEDNSDSQAANQSNDQSADSEADWQADVPPAEDPTEEPTEDLGEDIARGVGKAIETALNELSVTSDPPVLNGMSDDDLDDDSLMSEDSEDGSFDAFSDEDRDFEMEIPAADQRLTLSEEDDLLGALEALARRSVRDEPDAEDSEETLLAPVHLAKQQVLMEKAIRDVFKAISEEANELLQQADVMPNFPKALMAAAADSRGLGEPANAVPNVVKVSVRVMHGEANFDMLDSDEDGRSGYGSRGSSQGPSDRFSDSSSNRSSDRSSNRSSRSRRSEGRRSPRRPGDRTNGNRAGGRASSRSDNRSGDRNRSLSASSRKGEGLSKRFLPPNAIEIEAFPEFAVINLQLSEVEFTDPRVSVWRNRLRKEFSNLKQLGMRYQKTQRSLETAKAEDAWRSSWSALDEL